MQKNNCFTEELYSELDDRFFKNFGSFHKCLFHIHTPASHDYKIFDEFKTEGCASKQDITTIYNLGLKKAVIPFQIELSEIDFDLKIFSDQIEEDSHSIEGGADSFAHKSIIYEEYLNEMQINTNK